MKEKQPICEKCRGMIYGEYNYLHPNYPEEGFIGWDYESHECPPEEDPDYPWPYFGGRGGYYSGNLEVHTLENRNNIQIHEIGYYPNQIIVCNWFIKTFCRYDHPEKRPLWDYEIVRMVRQHIEKRLHEEIK